MHMQHIVSLMSRHKTESMCIGSIMCLLDHMWDSLAEHGNTNHKFVFLCWESTVKRKDILCILIHLLYIQYKEICITDIGLMRCLKSNQIDILCIQDHLCIQDIWRECMVHRYDFLCFIKEESTWKEVEMETCQAFCAIRSINTQITVRYERTRNTTSVNLK